MTSHLPDQHITAAITLWEHLAAFAWEQFISSGRGVVLMEEQALTRAAEAARSNSPPLAAQIGPGYVCVRDVPPSDDFAPIIAEYNPQRQIALLVRGSDEDERLYVLETSERHGRPTPRECFEARQSDQA